MYCDYCHQLTKQYSRGHCDRCGAPMDSVQKWITNRTFYTATEEVNPIGLEAQALINETPFAVMAWSSTTKAKLSTTTSAQWTKTQNANRNNQPPLITGKD